MVEMLPEYKKQAELSLKVAAGHLEGVRRMVEHDAYCVDLMKQLAAVQGTLQRVQRIFLRNHLSSCMSDAIKAGSGEEVIDELMTALKYDTSLIDGTGYGPGLLNEALGVQQSEGRAGEREA
jgi:DNA-binding FrmR family transcriptional regulator